MPLVTGVVVLIFGGLTLLLHDDTFIKMKPTIVNTLFGVVLLGGLLFGQSLLRYVFGDVYKLKPEGWTVLTLRWGLFFFVLAVLNEVVWRTQSHRFLGGVQGLGDDAADHRLRGAPAAGADSAMRRARHADRGDHRRSIRCRRAAADLEARHVDADQVAIVSAA